MKSKVIVNTRDVLVLVLAVLFISIGLAGNLLVVIAVWKKRSLRSTTNYLLVNLAVSDIINLTFLPFIAIQHYVWFEEGILADFMCKFFSYHIPLTASFASIITLLVLSIERYHAVVKPMKSGFRLRQETVHYAIISVWAFAICLTLPYYIFGYSRKSKCRHNLPDDAIESYVIIVMLTVVIVPFFVISFCYLQIVRELYLKPKQVGPQNVEIAEDQLVKRKLVKISLFVSLAYVICFFPMAITLFLNAYDEGKFGSKHYRNASILYFLESAVNPLLYSFQSSNFRQAFKELLRCRGCLR
ncbi:somatostatin receptor type 5-like [Actinia tenebrosa]|uniref:Somatostatin receptor type 5-like n=1 Tax=Actinia tenebrosa TaxID=6105 RepID=A0A6P8I7C4_ACTTE|nr:somatostatin receptor type 5-like [Actinia tenebrosa]